MIGATTGERAGGASVAVTAPGPRNSRCEVPIRLPLNGPFRLFHSTGANVWTQKSLGRHQRQISGVYLGKMRLRAVFRCLRSARNINRRRFANELLHS